MSDSPKKFVNLHAHTHASIADGLGPVEEHIDFCLENGMESMAFTEHGNCNSFAQAYLKTQDLKKKGRNFKLIPGCEAYYHPSLDQWKKDKFDHEERKRLEKERKKEEKKKSSEQLREELAADDGDGSTTENEDETKDVSKWRNPVTRRHHMVLLAKSEKGMENLFKLVSRSQTEGMYRFPRIDAKMLKEHGEDIIVTSACIGGFGAYSVMEKFQGIPFDALTPDLLDNPSKMEEVQRELGNAFDPIVDAVGQENVFAEVQFNKLAPQHLVNRALIEFSKRNGVKLTAAADSHYCRPELWLEREIYKKLGRMRFEDIDAAMLPQSKDALKCELYPKNADQMWDSYKEYTAGMSFYDDVVMKDAIERTHDIAYDMINEVKMNTSIKLPSFVIPPGQTSDGALVEACKEGLVRLGLDKKREYLERVKYELKIIKEKGFSQYFLLTKMIMDIAYDNMLVGAGRGSGAGSLVNYILGITQIDPMKYGLMFERFISLARNDTPDIDNDVSNRDKLLDLLRDKAGEKNVVPISNFMTLQLKSLVKDLSKLHKIDFQEVNEVTKDLLEEVMPKANDGENKSLFSLKFDDCMEHSEKFRDFMAKYPKVAEPIKVLYKQNRAIGKHAGGVVICEDLDKKMPLIVVKGEMRTPWAEGMNMHCLEPLGFVKSDILGISTLRMIENCISLILKRHCGNPNPTWEDVKEWYEQNLHPSVLGEMDDAKVFDHVFERRRFADIFQYTNPQTQKYIHDFAPKSVRDLSMATAIYRPGPLAAKVDKMIIKARRENQIKKYEHPVIDALLESTFGFIVYQEQIMQLANQLAGMSHADCDKLRKALLKRSVDKIDAKALEAIELGKQFVEGAEKNGFTGQAVRDGKFTGKSKAQELYDDIAAFAKYAFNYSHSLTYSVLSYQCCWLMTYFEPEWLCVYLQDNSTDDESKARAATEVRKLGYRIGKVDINESGNDWSLSKNGDTFYPSFRSIKGIGESAVEEIVQNRPYKNVHDLLWTETGEWKHSKFNKRVLDALVKIEGFDSMNVVGNEGMFVSYRHMYHVLVENMEGIKAKKLKKQKVVDASSIEIVPDRFLEPKDRLERFVSQTADIRDWTPQEKAEFHKELVGAVSPMSLVSPDTRRVLDEKGIKSIDDVPADGKKKAAWFIVMKGTMAYTKVASKPYVRLDVVGENGLVSRMFCWNLTNENDIPKSNTAYLAVVERTEFGLTLKKDLMDLTVLTKGAA